MVKPRIGTCSWKYPSWKGLVYSEGVTNYLEEYAHKYDTVEIDQWFWSLFPGGSPKLPLPGVIEEYRRSVPENFRFTIKAPNSITLTHYYAKEKGQPGDVNPYFLSPETAAEFLERINPLKPNLGPLIFQFEYLNRKKMPSQQEFEGRLAAFREMLPGGFSYAIEVRNGNYLNERFLECLADQDWILVLLQGYWMPSIVEEGGRQNPPVPHRHLPAAWNRPGGDGKGNRQDLESDRQLAREGAGGDRRYRQGSSGRQEGNLYPYQQPL